MTTTSEDAFEMRLVSVDVLHDSLQHWSSSSGSVVLNPVTIMSSATETTHVFAAVSYRWIPEDQACSFTVTDSGRNWTSKSGSHTMIEAVLTLASREGIRWIWMDSLCIDQSDAQDKAHAIRHMGSIYGRCAFVAAFVTADATNVEDVGYYSRVWTLQEQVLAPKLFLFRGQWMTLDQERQFWVKTYREIPANPPVNSLREQCYRVLAILGAATRGPSLSLAQVQQICHHRQCFVDQDRVYGILGCLKFRAELPVDYSKSTDNLWDLLCCQAIANGDYTILFTRLGTSQQTKRFVDIRQRPDSALGFDLDWNSGVLQFDVACNNIFVSKLMHCKVETKFNRIPKLRVSKQPEPPTKFKIMSQYGVFDPFKKAYVAPPALPASLTVELVRKNSNTSATFKDALNFNRFLLGRSTIGGFPSTKADEGTDAQHSTAINTAFGDVVLSSAPDSQHPVLTSAQLELICDAIFRFHSDPTESERKQVQNTLAPLVLTFKKHSPEIGGAFNNMQSLFDKKQTLEVRVPNEVLEPLYQVSRQDVFLVWAAKWDAGKHGSFQRGLLCIKAGQESGKGGTLKPVCQFFAPMKHAALLIDGKWTLS
ncbi:hypothetical protein BC830DRAFT_1166573 [Chytriomyces sp. MP71]|nr:hypothetical protein BC830DRAFT_1166573 [Chytriomyces sp. MP71]